MFDLALTVVPILSFTASAVLLALGLAQVISASFQFWPPPADQPWKKRAFMVLFRIVVYGLIASSAMYLWQNGLPSISPLSLLSLLLLSIGFGVAFASTMALGWSNAFGSKKGLQTSGIFKYSRNPIYIATWFGLGGWAALVPIPLVVATLLFWGLLYVVAIFTEEEWLAQQYGQAYQDYCRNVRRFF